MGTDFDLEKRFVAVVWFNVRVPQSYSQWLALSNLCLTGVIRVRVRRAGADLSGRRDHWILSRRDGCRLSLPGECCANADVSDDYLTEKDDAAHDL